MEEGADQEDSRGYLKRISKSLITWETQDVSCSSIGEWCQRCDDLENEVMRGSK